MKQPSGAARQPSCWGSSLQSHPYLHERGLVRWRRCCASQELACFRFPDLQVAWGPEALPPPPPPPAPLSIPGHGRPLQAPGMFAADGCPRFAQLSVVYKFGGSSVATAARMREVAAIVCSFPEQAPLVVLSAMGKVGAGPERYDHTLYGLTGPLRYHSIMLRSLNKASSSRVGDIASADRVGGRMVLRGRYQKVNCGQPVQTTNLLLQAGEEALSTDPEHIAELAPLRCCLREPSPPA